MGAAKQSAGPDSSIAGSEWSCGPDPAPLPISAVGALQRNRKHRRRGELLLPIVGGSAACPVWQGASLPTDHLRYRTYSATAAIRRVRAPNTRTIDRYCSVSRKLTKGLGMPNVSTSDTFNSTLWIFSGKNIPT